MFVLACLAQFYDYLSVPVDCFVSPTSNADKKCTLLGIGKNYPPHGFFFNGNRDVLKYPSVRSGHTSFAGRWQPDGCILHRYSQSSVEQCLQSLEAKNVVIGGNGRLHSLTKEAHDETLTDIVDQQTSVHQEITNALSDDAVYDIVTVGTESFVAVWSGSVVQLQEKNVRGVSVSTVPSGLHVYPTDDQEAQAHSARTFRLLALNQMCNNVLVPTPYDATCSLAFPWMTMTQILTLVILLDVIGCIIYIRALGPTKIAWINKMHNASVQNLICVVLLVVVCASTGLFGVAIKGWNATAWWLTSILVFIVTLLGVQPAKDATLLNRNQTAEWRGWMQVAFLIYHYLGAGKVPMPLYIWIRMMVASFMFMTGFGHTTYFLMKNNYSFKRVWQVISRLNLLQLLLCATLGRPWIFYYFTPLATVWFGCIYMTMYVYSSRNQNTFFVSMKVVVLIAVVEIVLWSPSSIVYQVLFMNPLTRPLLELGGDDGRFFQSRMAMDRYSVPAGMLFAIFLHKWRTLPQSKSDGSENDSNASSSENTDIKLGVASTNEQRWVAVFHWLQKISVIVAPLVLITYGIYSYQAPGLWEGKKKRSIPVHTVFSPIVILAFIAVRNHPKFMVYKYVSKTLAWVGGCSLELFILQYHLLLAVPNESSLGPAATLQLVPGSPLVSALFASVLLFAASHCASVATNGVLKLINIDVLINAVQQLNTKLRPDNVIAAETNSNNTLPGVGSQDLKMTTKQATLPVLP